METQKLKSILLTQAQNLGADLCGIADLTADSRWIQETYGDLCASFPRAVSIAIFSAGNHSRAGCRPYPFL